MALNKALEYREWFKDLDNAKFFILNHTFTSENIWGSYHKAVICGLTGDCTKLNEYFQKLLKENHPGEWLNELKNRVNHLAEKAHNKNIFRETIIEIIKDTRMLKKLPETEVKLYE